MEDVIRITPIHFSEISSRRGRKQGNEDGRKRKTRGIEIENASSTKNTPPPIQRIFSHLGALIFEQQNVS
jgi:hypothetical protein